MSRHTEPYDSSDSEHAREFRIALVLYGGASLAVWMHGVTKELLKLTRASRAHSDANARALFYEDGDSEAVYAEILDELFADSRGSVRVVLDVIAGASAGAINGLYLGKAVSQDLSLDVVTGLWLDDADIDSLTTPPRRGWLWQPMVRFAARFVPTVLRDDPEAYEKVLRLLSRPLMRAPLAGRLLLHRMLDAFAAMRASRDTHSSLMPFGQTLDVLASVTDLHGYTRSLGLDPEHQISEVDHAALCRFVHRETEAGRAESDFVDANDPGLAWAARASASYPGAFPPFHHQELMDVIRERNQGWPNATARVARMVYAVDGRPLQDRVDPCARWFLDGGLVNNKPLSAALSALQEKPADRAVNRFLLFVEPDPGTVHEVDQELPNRWFAGILHAASKIPRNQPVNADLERVSEINARARMNREILREHSDDVDATIRPLLPELQAISATALAEVEAQVAHAAVQQYGRAWRVYGQRRSRRLADALVEGWSRLLPRDPQRRQLATMSGAVALLSSGASGSDPDRMRERFLFRFDVLYRMRRIAFLIQAVNDELSGPSPASRAMQDFKRDLWSELDVLQAIRAGRALPAGLRRELTELLVLDPDLVPTQVRIRRVMLDLARYLDLGAVDARIRTVVAAHLTRDAIDTGLRLRLLGRFAGFGLYDPLLTGGGDYSIAADTTQEIHVARLSPAEPGTLTGAFTGLRSRQLFSFAGFFNRSWREHDYLWGRLHAADRLVDLLVELAPRDAKVEPLRQRLLRSILLSERSRLKQSSDLLDTLEGALIE